MSGAVSGAVSGAGGGGGGQGCVVNYSSVPTIAKPRPRRFVCPPRRPFFSVPTRETPTQEVPPVAAANPPPLFMSPYSLTHRTNASTAHLSSLHFFGNPTALSFFLPHVHALTLYPAPTQPNALPI